MVPGMTVISFEHFRTTGSLVSFDGCELTTQEPVQKEPLTQAYVQKAQFALAVLLSDRAHSLEELAGDMQEFAQELFKGVKSEA
jgi:hypothetical protein